jgi:hypothetical protein
MRINKQVSSPNPNRTDRLALILILVARCQVGKLQEHSKQLWSSTLHGDCN